MIPKIDRNSELFSPSVCDKINKKVQLMENNINKIEVTDLYPKIDISDIDISLNSDYSLSNNTSFIMGKGNTRMVILNFTIKRSSSSSITTMTKIGTISVVPLTDVWFCTYNGKSLIHIPAGEQNIYLYSNGETEIDIYTWYL